MAPADQQQTGPAGAQRGMESRDVGEDRGQGQFDAAGRCSQHLGDARCQRSEVDAVRCVAQPLQRQSVGLAPNASPKGRDAASVETALVASLREQCGELLDGPAGHRRMRDQRPPCPAWRRSPARPRSPGRRRDPFPSTAAPTGTGSPPRPADRPEGRTPAVVARGAAPPPRTVRRRSAVRTWEGGGSMTSACRVVSLRYGSTDTMNLQARHRPGQPFAVGRGESRVARDGHQRANLALAGSGSPRPAEPSAARRRLPDGR